MDESPKTSQHVTGWKRFVIGRNPKHTLIRVVVVVLASYLVFHFVLLPIRVTGNSMSPTYKDGQINAINQLAYKFGDPQRYDVVLVRPREGTNTNSYLKRIVGLPGESIRFDRGTIYINDEPLSEPYIRRKLNWTWPQPYRLKPDEYYVVGDNRTMHPESHAQGPVTRAEIIGRIVMVHEPQ